MESKTATKEEKDWAAKKLMAELASLAKYVARLHEPAEVEEICPSVRLKERGRWQSYATAVTFGAPLKKHGGARVKGG